MNGIVKFKADFHLNSQAEGGRATPIQNGFRSDLEFEKGHRIASVELTKELMMPGENASVILHVWLHSDQEIDWLLANGLTCLVDGATRVAEVTIVSVVDRDCVDWGALS